MPLVRNARIALLAAALLATSPALRGEELHPYAVVGGAIQLSLTGTKGDSTRGRALLVERSSTCILCHSGPFPEQAFQGDLAPNLAGSGSRWCEGALRLP